MNSFYFGTRARRLFGVYHPPETRQLRSTGVIICPPLFLEQSRGRRALRQMAVELAERGFHVLRFDYHGTGESGGSGDAESLAGWVQDTATAMEELHDLTAVRRHALIGVRFGGVIASLAGAASRTIDHLILWDPICAGSRYPRWLLERAGFSDPRGWPRANPARGDLETWSDRGVVGIDGFRVSLRLLREVTLSSVGHLPCGEMGAERVTLLSSSPQEVSGLLNSLQDSDVPHLFRSLPDEAGWEDGRRQGDAVVAPRAISEIVASLSMMAA